MQLDDLKLAWQALDRQLERRFALDLHAFKATRLDRLRAGLRPMQAGLWLRILFGAALIAASAATWPNYWQYPVIVVCGAAVQIYGIATCALSGRALWLIHEIDYAAPVLRIQQELARLRAFHLRSSFWLGNAWWVLWVPLLPLLLVWTTSAEMLNSRLTIDGVATGETLPDQLGRAWPNLLYYLIPCLLMMALFAWLYRLWKIKRPDSFARFERQSARGLTNAMDMLREIERFERS
ncbi:MAG: hypothetical protein QM741_01375 [Rudaea sp.]|uniref:hypothetical protein n=1 Tax=Rudaea sp. TaxID=2136325 RepID=UPI0039E6D401